MDHTPGQRDGDPGAHSHHEKGKPIRDQVQVKVGPGQQQDKRQYQPGQAIQLRSAAAAGASKPAEPS
jgi:hypothetical protein